MSPPIEIWASYSSIMSHRACPQKWYYARVRNLQPIEEEIAPKRDFGSWWHALMAADALERGRRYGSLRSVPEWIEAGESARFNADTVTPADVLDEADRYWKGLTEAQREMWAELGEPLGDRLRYVYARWLDRWEAARGHERPLAVEMGWGRDLPGGVARLVGYCDEVYQDTRRNLIVIRDHKSSWHLGTTYVEDEMFDSQLHLYYWGAEPEIDSWGIEAGGRAVEWDRVRTAPPTTPVLTQAGSLSKSVTQFDLHTYRTWTEAGQTYSGRRKDGSDGGTYVIEDSVIERLSQPDWLSIWQQRSAVPYNRHTVGAHLRAAIREVNEMSRTKRLSESFPGASRSPGHHCRWCDFKDLCRAELLGGPLPEGDDLTLYGLRTGAVHGRSQTPVPATAEAAVGATTATIEKETA